MRPILIAFVAIPCIGLAFAADEKKTPEKKPVARKCVIDLVPENAAISIGVNSIKSLHDKGDQFLKDTEWKINFRPSDIFDMVLQSLGDRGLVDRDEPYLVVVPDQNDIDGTWELFELLNKVVTIFPVTSRRRIEDALGLKAGSLKDGEIVGPETGWRLLVRDGLVYNSRSEKSLRSVLKSKPLTDKLTDEQKKAFRASDVVWHLNPHAFEKEARKEFFENVEKILKDNSDPFGDPQLGKQLVETSKAIRFTLASFQVDDGLSVKLAVNFDENEKAKAFLKALGAGGKSCDLRSLPLGSLVFGQAARGDGAQTAAFSRTIVHSLLSSSESTKGLINSADRALYLGVFSEIWQQMRGTKIGLYQNDNPSEHGFYSAASIIETDDAEKFLKELKKLARIGSGGLKLADPTSDDFAEVKKLIADLASPRFRVRESATTKLCLIGEPAITLLDKAANGDDPDVNERVKKIREQIAQNAELRRKELLTDGLKPLRPTFAFAEKSERRNGIEVETIHIRLGHEDKAAIGQLKQLFGPKWHQIRLANSGNRTAIVFGSDDSLLDRTIANLQKDKPALAKAPFVPDFLSHCDPDRKMEFHFSLERMAAFMRGDDIRKPEVFKKATVTSVGLTVGENRLQVDLWVPIREFKAFRVSQGW